MKLLKILMFTPFYPPHTGGVEQYAQELSNVLAKKEFHITIFTPLLPPNCPQKETYKNIEILRYPAFEIIKNYPFPKFWKKEYRLLKKNIKNQTFNIILSHTRFFISSLLALLYSKKSKLPLLHIEHGSSFVQSENLFISITSKIYDYLIGKQILNQARAVVAVSKSVETFVKSLAPKTNIRVIYRSLDAQKIESISENEKIWREHQNKLKIIFIGRLIKAKGIFDLVQSLSLLPFSNWVCIIIGDGMEKKALQNKIKSLNLQNKIFLLGEKSWGQTISVLKGADLFINPSYSEGIPTTVLESSFCGIPTIATNVGGTNEISPLIKLIPPKDILILKENITLIFKNLSEIKRESKNQSIEIKQKFSRENAFSSFYNLIESLASST